MLLFVVFSFGMFVVAVWNLLLVSVLISSVSFENKLYAFPCFPSLMSTHQTPAVYTGIVLSRKEIFREHVAWAWSCSKLQSSCGEKEVYTPTRKLKVAKIRETWFFYWTYQSPFQMGKKAIKMNKWTKHRDFSVGLVKRVTEELTQCQTLD